MKIIGCVNAYQDAEMLKRSLPVLARLVDRLIVVDGAYADFPIYGGIPTSTDGTLDVARCWTDEIVWRPTPWENEIEKRNAYLIGEPGDWYLVCDADEVLEGAIFGRAAEPSCACDRCSRARTRAGAPVAEATPDGRDDWLVDLYRVEQHDLRQPIHRLFRHRPGIRYAGTHHAVHVGADLVHPDRLPVVPGLAFRHLTAERPVERVERKGAYYGILGPSERAFRAAHAL